MGIKLIGGRPAYYRSIRQGDRVRSVYLASGPGALTLAERDAETKRKSKMEREADEARARQTAEWFGRVERIARAAILAAGWHQWKRQWRRRRTMNDELTIAPAAPAPAPTPARPGKRGMTEEGRGILARVEAGDGTINHREARLLFRERPDLLETTGNPAHSLLMAWMVKSYPDTKKAEREALVQNIKRVAADLAGPDPTPLERLLAERAAVCWAEVNGLELCIAAGQCSTPGSNGSYWIKRIDSANRRYLAALRTLAVVRKLGVPGLQVNIDARSVRLAPAPPTADLGGIDDGRSG